MRRMHNKEKDKFDDRAKAIRTKNKQVYFIGSIILRSFEIYLDSEIIEMKYCSLKDLKKNQLIIY